MFFLLPPKIFEALRYFGLYKFVRLIGADPELAGLPCHHREEVDLSKVSVRDGFVSYSFSTGKVYLLSEEVVQAKKPMKHVNRVPMTVTTDAVLLTFRADVSRVDLASVRQDCDNYCRWESGVSEADRKGANGVVDLDALLG